ncbi:hypothetical protein ACFHW2_39805 [Actinomadura sp. LOL_016]|uniref:hypothetical protein n=1 Tax=unclassified Actinomadura TaxID=2626254 RepID=UPI003A80F8F8
MRVAEHLVQDEHGPFERREGLQDDEEGHRDGLGAFGGRVGARDEGVGRPGPM